MTENLKKISWKTTVSGVLMGLFIVVGEIADVAHVPLGNFTDGIFSMEQLMVGIGLIGVGVFARDNDKSSEDIGAK